MDESFINENKLEIWFKLEISYNYLLSRNLFATIISFELIFPLAKPLSISFRFFHQQQSIIWSIRLLLSIFFFLFFFSVKMKESVVLHKHNVILILRWWLETWKKSIKLCSHVQVNKAFDCAKRVLCELKVKKGIINASLIPVL